MCPSVVCSRSCVDVSWKFSRAQKIIAAEPHAALDPRTNADEAKAKSGEAVKSLKPRLKNVKAIINLPIMVIMKLLMFFYFSLQFTP